ncbi:hypothetical protein TNCT_617151 [Trichonephila clavata]|uniref:Uncharacterized protein n=1 Tax=Trichonephila clavata TaxID=2740835 RepID=A0A8X6I2H0_TRICU|nr:hypothetical protein TNCT_617151 [Trichonephila clavata]
MEFTPQIPTAVNRRLRIFAVSKGKKRGLLQAQIRIIESLFVGLDNEQGGPEKWGGGISDTSDNGEKCWLLRQWILDWDHPFDQWCVYWKIRWLIVRNHHDHSGVEKKTGLGNKTDAFERVEG